MLRTILFCLSLMLPVPAFAVLMNGDFSAGLTGWTTEGDVTSDREEARLGDNGVFYSSLYQAADVGRGGHQIEFDFQNGLTGPDPVDPFSFPDSLFSSIYFADDLASFDVAAGQFDDVIGLFDMDNSGTFSVNPEGVIGASSKGADWSHFTMSFTSAHRFVIPTFELLEQNFIDNDSQVLVDNVALSAAVPEPGTLALLGAGIVWVVLARRRGGEFGPMSRPREQETDTGV